MDIFSKDFDAEAVLDGAPVEGLQSARAVAHKSIDDFERRISETSVELCNVLRAVEFRTTKTKVKLPTGKKREKKLQALCLQKAEQEEAKATDIYSIEQTNQADPTSSKPSASTAARPVIEVYKKKLDNKDVLSKMKRIEGPLAKLHEWVQTRRRVRIVLRGRNAPNAVVTAVVVAFDKHWNIIFRDGDEIFLPPAKLSREISKENLDNLDIGYRRIQDPQSSKNFEHIGKSRKLYGRHLKCSMIRGENVVLIQQA